MKYFALLLTVISASLGALLGTLATERVAEPRLSSPKIVRGGVPSRSAPASVTDSWQPQTIGHPSFMSPHSSPIAVHGKHVWVVNTPADTVDLINIQQRRPVHRISVGVDPVSIAVRPDGNEIWISNHVSDSVSVIDSDETSPTYLQVIATIQDFDRATRSTRFDEPVGIAFANNNKAYVALSSENQIAVVDVASRQITDRLHIPAQDPRSIVVHEDRLFVIPFESNNQTQLSGGRKEDIDGDLVTFDAWEHSIVHNNVLSLGHVVDIVKHPDVPDHDLFVFDTNTDTLVETFDSLGTLLYGMTISSTGDVFIAQTDARNDVNGRAGTKDHGLAELENRAFLNRVTRVAAKQDRQAKREIDVGPQVAFFDQEPLPPNQPVRANALATPFAIEIGNDGRTLFVTAAGSDKFVSLDADSGKMIGSVEVGGVPRGIALDPGNEKTGQAWIFNAVDNSVSLVEVTDPSQMQVIDTIWLEDPTDPIIKRGRKIFNSADASSTGTFSCASCHPDGHTDQLLWVLKTPVVSGGDQIMPRSTMPIRGLRETAPFHWDGIPGDPYGGNNSANVHGRVAPNSDLDSPASTTRHLIDGALSSTMAMVRSDGENEAQQAGLLTPTERDDLAKFLLSVPYPPAQRRAYTNELSNQAREGFELFHIKGDDDPSKSEPNVCGDCHRMPNWVSTNTPGTGMDAPTWRGAYDRWLILPQGRLNIIEFPFFKRVAEQGLDERQIWQFSWGGRARFDPVWNMVLEGSTGFSGTFARQVTLNQATAVERASLDLLEAMETSAREQSCVLAVSGALEIKGTFQPVSYQFVSKDGQGIYRDIGKTQPAYTRDELISLAQSGTFVGTFTAQVAGDHGFQNPQPVIWTKGRIEQQRGQQLFPFLHPDQLSMTVSGRHVDSDASIFVNGRRVKGSLNIDGETIQIALKRIPPVGMHLLQLQNGNGLFSNDFIFHVAQDQESAATSQAAMTQARSNMQTLLIDAAAQGNHKKIRSLLKRGVQVDARHPESGETALSAASLRGDLELAKLLIDQGATVSQTNRDGNTPLHVAAFFCRENIVNLLLEHGASVTQKNSRGETAVDVVAGAWNEGLAQFYTAIADSSGFEIDLEQIQQDRKKIERRMRTHSPRDQDSARWNEIDARPLPDGYHGSSHQEFVDQQMKRLSPSQRMRVGKLWEEKQIRDPEMDNRGYAFVRILMFVVEEAGQPDEAAISPKPNKRWFRSKPLVGTPVFSESQTESP